MTICGDADFSRTVLEQSCLSGSHLGGADLALARLDEAELDSARFENAVLDRTTFTGALLHGTLFSSVNLATAVGLDTCEHGGPSVIDVRTLQISGTLPASFMRGVGFPDIFIDYLPSLTTVSIQMCSCFISYSTKDQKFAEKIYEDLQFRGVRCWFAPHDLNIGAKTWNAIDQAIRIQDKVIVILSKNSIAINWVEDEINKAFAEERRRKRTVLVPIRIDSAAMTTSEGWAVKLRDQRNIGDFSHWRNNDAYEFRLKQLLNSLSLEPE